MQSSYLDDDSGRPRVAFEIVCNSYRIQPTRRVNVSERPRRWIADVERLDQEVPTWQRFGNRSVPAGAENVVAVTIVGGEPIVEVTQLLQ